MDQHTISVLVENKFGVLARVAGLFSGRGYNIDSLSVNKTNDPKVSRMTIVTNGDEDILEQIDKQLNKLIDVIKVTDLSGSQFIERELILIKVKTKEQKRSELIQITEIFKGKIVNANKDELTMELSGSTKKINNYIEMLSEYDIVELIRTGRVAISREPGVTEDYSDL